MIKIIDNPKIIRKLQQEFVRKLTAQLNQTVEAYVGFPGGKVHTVLYFSKRFDIWLAIDDNLDNRYWNGFGLGTPNDGSLESLTVEINVPKQGIDRRIGGVFGKDDNGNILILHRGKIGGGKSGVGKSLFKDKYRGPFVTVIDGDITNNLALIGELSSDKLVTQVATFVKEVRRIKYENSFSRGTTNTEKNTESNFNSEFAGTKVYSTQEVIHALCNHGIVVNALAEELKKRNFVIGNDRNRDLYIKSNKGNIITIFEIKTDTLSSSLYSAIGQLILYSVGLDKKIELYLVLPDELKPEIKNRIKSIGLDILYYNWQGDGPIFKDLDKILNK